MSAQALESLKSKEEKGTRMKHQYGARVDLPAQFVTLKLGGETYQGLWEHFSRFYHTNI